MAQRPLPSSSSESRKRKFAEKINQNVSPPSTNSPNQSIDNPPTDELTTSEAITEYFQWVYNDQLVLDQGSMKSLLDPSTTSLQKLKAASQFSSIFNDSKPFAEDSPVWAIFTTQVADAVVDLFKSPGTFQESRHVAVGTIEVCSDENPWEAGPDLAYVYYTRVLDVESAEEYAALLELSGRCYPEDLPFVILQLQYLGFGSRGSSLLKEVMIKLGYPNVKLKLNRAVEGIHPSTRPMYSRATFRTPKVRQDEDMSPGENTSRIRNFSKITQDFKWRRFIWTPLQQGISDKLEWRTKKELGQLEAVLTDCIIPNFNKARGGWVHPIQLDPTISIPLKAMLGMLPKPRAADPTPPTLTTNLSEMLDAENAFLKLLGNPNEFGNFFGPVAMEHLKREFVGAIRCIKGSVSSITLTKDLPQEAGHGLINTSLDGGQVGRSVTLYQAMLTAIYDLEGGERAYGLLRQLDGSFIDFWHSFEYHKWWGLLILLIGLFFHRAMPYTIHTWSSVAGGIFDSNLLHTLPRDLKIDSLQGPDAIAALTPDILDHPVIKQAYHVPQDYGFREKQGKVRPVRIGPGKLDYANQLSKGDPGDLFYRQGLFRHDKRRHALLNGLSVGLNRLTEERLASQAHPTTGNAKIQFLKEIRDEFDRVVLESGVRKVLDEELRRQRIRDRAQGALLGKKVEGGGAGNDDGDGDEGFEDVVKRGRKRRNTGKKPLHPRNNGLLALGEPYSDERRGQLAGLRKDAEAAVELDLQPEILWSDDLTALSPDFAGVFLNLKTNHSLQQSLNAHGRTPEGIQGHIDNGKRLGQLRKDWERASRAKKTELMGGWTRAEQFEELSLLLPTLRVDMTTQKFQDSPRSAKCTNESCLARVFGQSKDSKHRCNEETDPELIVKTSFELYIRPLYAHDLFGLTDVDPDVLELVAGNCHLTSSPAADWVLDQNGTLLPTFPFPLPPRASITGVVYWDENKPKDPRRTF